MSMVSWSEREIELLKEKNKSKECEFDYIGSCCDSALKAFKSLMDDGHSGMSIGITANILNNLIKGKPLTPIEDTEDVWNKVNSYCEDRQDIEHYQCKRMSALFKDIYPDGKVEYHDVDRARGTNINNPNSYFSNGLISKIVNDMFPITMPYTPVSKPYVVYTEDFLTDSTKGDYDTVGYLYMITPEGEKIELNKFFHEFDRHQPMKEISKKEYEELKKSMIY